MSEIRVSHLGDSDFLVSYRPAYDDLTIELDGFSLTLERDEFESLRLFLLEKVRP